MPNPEAGFNFARALRDPDFRAQLEADGHVDGEPVYIAGCGENINATLARGGPGSYFVATEDDAFDGGFRFCRIDIGAEVAQDHVGDEEKG